TQPTRFWETPAAAWRLVIETNVVGPFLMARAAVPAMLEHRWGRIVNISMNAETMRRRGFSPYGPSKAALESATAIWAKDLADSGITVNALLPGGATLSGMIPQNFPDHLRATLLDPEVMVPPLLWIASTESDGVTGRRFIATKWRPDHPESEAAGWEDGCEGSWSGVLASAFALEPLNQERNQKPDLLRDVRRSRVQGGDRPPDLVL